MMIRINGWARSRQAGKPGQKEMGLIGGKAGGIGREVYFFCAYNTIPDLAAVWRGFFF